MLYEGQPSVFWAENKVPISEVLRHAVWWRQIRPRDKDQFASIDLARRTPRTTHVTCAPGKWEKRPAHRLHMDSKWNAFGGSVLLFGRPPCCVQLVNKTFRPIPVELKLVGIPGKISIMGNPHPIVPGEQLTETSVLIELPPDLTRNGPKRFNVGIYSQGVLLQTVPTTFIGPRE